MSLSAIPNLDYAILLCSRMAETRAFYRDVMGFSIEPTLNTGSASTSVPGSASVQLAFRVPPPSGGRLPCGAGRQGSADPARANRFTRLASPHPVLPRPRRQHHQNLRRVLTRTGLTQCAAQLPLAAPAGWQGSVPAPLGTHQGAGGRKPRSPVLARAGNAGRGRATGRCWPR